MINLQPSINFGHDLKANLCAGLWLFIGSRRSLEYVRPSVLQFLFWGVLAGSANSLFSWLISGGYGYFNTQGLVSYALWPFLALISGVFLSQKVGDNRLLLMPVILWLVLDSYVILIQSLIQFLVQINFFPIFLDPYLPKLFTALFVWQSLSIVWVLSRELKWLWWERILVFIGTLATLVVWQISTQNQPIWKIDEVTPTLDETIFYAQPKILNQALQNIQMSSVEQSHWYFMGVAGASYQDVFKSEIERIKQQFDTRFNTQGRSIALINNPNTGLDVPIASKTSIEQSLKEIGQKMNREQDVLFLYLTSHGLENQFQLENQPIDLEDIDPTWLRKTLDNAGIRWRVIVISACRSGSFIPALQSPDTLIITAAASDKDSFGCTHEAEYTYFGRAFFDQAMRDKTSIKQAFITAQTTVAEWEKNQGFIPSEPQWSMGKNIELMLPQFEKILFPQPISNLPTQETSLTTP
ncbi:C13 family peptidase [Moraxella sp. ZY210820]|uniref:C13 family peptidase n=1 Tax=unclassified Moraxella TaxID=2685852 RepID=UPI0027313B34|nr:C13 family peptidase [Moraxella sp. ZY210820]WLF83413.1 C13 family peptidase [Moraxella sp. ZY210820]